MAHANPINDILLRLGVEDSVQVDLKAAFGSAYEDFSISSSDGTAIDAAIDENGILTIATTGELGFSNLVVTAIDGDGNSVTDHFRARAAGPNAFTVAALPDTQNYTSSAAMNHIFGDVTQWLANNAESLGIKFVIGLGDVTDNNNAAQWTIASEALHRLDGKIPYSILPGNHDQAPGGSAADHSSDFLDTLFSPQAQAAINPDTFGGVYDQEPNRSANTYHTFAAPDGTKWLVLSLEFAPRDDVMRWASDVIEGHLDHRVIIASHTLTNESQRQDAFGAARGNSYPVQNYGVANDPQGANDGESVYRQLTSKFPNVVMTLSGHEIGEDGAQTNFSYSQYGNKVAEMLADYQGGANAEVLPNHGQIRLLTIDPDNGAIYTSTYLTEEDAYFEGYRGSEELDRDGLTGVYKDHQQTITGLDLGAVEVHAHADAGQDLFVSATAGADRATVRLDATGTRHADLAETWKWLDENGQVVATGAQADIVLAAGKHRLTLEVTDESGQVTTDEKMVVVSGANTLLMENFNDGDAYGWVVPGQAEGIGTWQLQGTAFAPGTAPGLGEAALHDRTNANNKFLVWGDAAAKAWSNYSFDITLTSTDNDTIGVVFYYQDERNYYRFVMDDQATARTLYKVQNGVQTVLATSREGYRFNDALDLRVVVSGDKVNVLLDGASVFAGGPVTVTNPLASGSIGVFTTAQKSAIFDDILVNSISLTANAEGDARSIAATGADSALVHLTAAASYGPDAIVGYKWLVDGEVVATTRDAQVQLAVGTKSVLLEVTDSTGKVSTDTVNVDVIGHDRLLARDDFNRTELGNSWRIIDEGTIGGWQGTISSHWEMRDGRLWEASNLYSEQLTVGGGTASSGVWALGWSPLGDGDHILRRGTIALYEPAGVQVQEWKDYSVEVNFQTNDNDGLGLVFYYQDPSNYYKIELDEEQAIWTLTRLKNGIEQVLGQSYGGYVPGKKTDLRIDIVDHKIMAYVDGDALFPLPIEDRELDGGTFGLYDWGSDSLSFDDVRAISLASDGTDPEPSNTAPVAADDTGLGTAYGASLTIDAAALLANDTDANSDTLAILSVTSGTGGTVALDNDGHVVFTPTDGFEGEATFIYTVSDGKGGTSTATVTVTVAPQPEVPAGTQFDDELTGTSGDDVIAALAGDDLVSGDAGNDDLDGGIGDDTLFGGAGDDILRGGVETDPAIAGDDVLHGGEGDDILIGGAGDDTLDGGEGSDTADYSDDTAGIVVDLAAGSAEGDAIGSDELASIETVIAGSGDDVLAGDAANNRLEGGAGRDTLVLAAATGAIALDLSAGTVSAAGLGTDSFTGIEAFQLGDGDDRVTLIAGAAAVAIDGGEGHDTLVLTGAGTLGDLTQVEAVEFQGSWTLTDEGYDVVFQDGAQVLTLAAGLLADGEFSGTIAGFAEEDRIELSGLGATEATLGAGNLLTLTGGVGGAVTLQLDPATDYTGMAFTLASNGHGGSYLSFGPANAGDDVLTGGNGNDSFDGGAGNDTLKGAAGNDTLNGGSGDDLIDGGSGDDTVHGGTGNDMIKAGSGTDTIDAGAGDDLVDAGSGDDVILAGAGNDTVDAGSGDDRIEGGAGDDTLTGGSGHDVFVFAAGFGKDIVTDFKTTGTSSDVLEFSADVFADFENALEAADQIGSDVVFAIDTNTTLTLKGVQLSSLAQDDFRFV